MNSAIQKAITAAGSQKELARRVGVDQSAVSKWLNGGGIRSQYIPAIISASNGQLTVSEILSSLERQESLNPNASTASA